MTAALLQIIDWKTRFEPSTSAVLDIHDSPRLLNVMGEVDGTVIYGVFMLVVDLCRRQMEPREGWLTRNGRRDGERYTTQSLSKLFHRDQAEILRMMKIMSGRDVGLIRFVEGDFGSLRQEYLNRGR